MPGLMWRLTAPLLRKLLPDLPPVTHEVEIRRGLQVPMSDGVTLIGDLYLPVSPSGTTAPTVLMRSPYGRKGPIILFEVRPLAERGFPVFVQSCRGTFGSGGTFSPQVHEQADGEDTLRWVRAQPWFTGKLVTTGASYLGYNQWAVAGHLAKTDPQVAADALALQVTMPDFGAITWDNGAFALRSALGWSRQVVRQEKPYASMMLPLPDPKLEKAFNHLPLRDGDLAVTGQHIPWYQDWVERDDLSDPFWTQQSHTASVPDVNVPVSMRTGWYDLFLPWQLRNYAALVAAGNPPELTVGPWGHISHGMHATTAAEVMSFYRRRVMNDPSAPPREDPVKVFITGAGEWRGYGSWPPPGTTEQDWYLAPGGGFSSSSGASSGWPAGTEPTRYEYDPADPTPALGGPMLVPKVDPVDNTEHEKRSDVVVFTSDALSAPLELTGEPSATIWLRTDRPTTDVFVRICDVHPDGRSMNLCDGIRRIGGRGTTAIDPRPDETGAHEVQLTLWPVGHRFLAGHRIRVQISSGAHPRYARNLGGDAAAFEATVPYVAHQEVLHEPGRESRLTLPVLPA